MTNPHAVSESAEPLLGTTDVAQLLGMSREQVWRLWSSGRLAGYRFDRHVRFARSDVERFMAQHYSGTSVDRRVVKAVKASVVTSLPGRHQATQYQPI